MEDALVRILTPKRSIDILRDVHAAKEQGKPYVVVFVGVNGVGKSTNLAKVSLASNSTTPCLSLFQIDVLLIALIPLYNFKFEGTVGCQHNTTSCLLASFEY